jgi:hypothetical protein
MSLKIAEIRTGYLQQEGLEHSCLLKISLLCHLWLVQEPQLEETASCYEHVTVKSH